MKRCKRWVCILVFIVVVLMAIVYISKDVEHSAKEEVKHKATVFIKEKLEKKSNKVHQKLAERKDEVREHSAEDDSKTPRPSAKKSELLDNKARETHAADKHESKRQSLENRRQKKSVSDDNASPEEIKTSSKSATTTKESEVAGADNVGIAIEKSVFSNENKIYQEAENLIEKREYQKAISLLDNKKLALSTEGQSAVMLGTLYLNLHEVDLAEAYLNKVMRYKTNANAELAGLLGQAYFIQEKYQQALDVLSKESPSLVRNPSYYALLARTYMQVDQAVSAAQVLQQLVAKFPNNPNYWLVLALAYQQADDKESAEVAYDRVLKLNDENPQVVLFVKQQLEAMKVL